MNTPRPTPETDAAIIAANGTWTFELKESMQKLERERDEAREALSGRTVSCSQCNETGKQLEAMREAIKEVSLQLTFAEKVSGASVLHIYVYDALAKLQSFIKP